MFKLIATFVIVFIAWVILTMSVSLQELVIGLFVSAVIAVMTKEFLFSKEPRRSLEPRRWESLVLYFLVFIYEEARAHANLARMIIT